MDDDLSRFIAAGRLRCRVDKVAGVVVTEGKGQAGGKGGKGGAFEGLLKQGDLLLNGKYHYLPLLLADIEPHGVERGRSRE